MNDAVTTTDDQSAQTTDQTPEPTLDDVYKSVQFDQPAQQQPVQQQPVYQQPVQQQQPVPSSVPAVPDPYDTEAFKAYMARQEAGTTELKTALSSTLGFLTNLQRQEATKAIDADIQAAVKAVDEVVGLGKPKVIEAWLDGKAREDSRFKQLWDNRSKNPTAWNNALKAVSREMQKDFSMQTDPKLTVAQQARRLSQSQMATTQQDEPDDSWNNLSEADFARKWENMTNRGA